MIEANHQREVPFDQIFIIHRAVIDFFSRIGADADMIHVDVGEFLSNFFDDEVLLCLNALLEIELLAMCLEFLVHAGENLK